MSNILLTGGRAPATLELARLLNEAGHRVFLAESLGWNLTQFSRAVVRTYTLPSPRQHFQEFLDVLVNIVNTEKIDLLIPTCEEIFWVAKAKMVLNEYCTVFCEYLPELDVVHHKWHFIQHCQELGLSVPPTQLLTAEIPIETLRFSRLKVFKPVYSRFASKTLIRPTEEEARKIRLSPPNPWVAQDFVQGRTLCTYSIVHQGKITAHTAYYADYTAHHAAVAFDSVIHTKAQSFVERFVESINFTGQIAFDFIEMADGSIWGIECNPRLTSGIHLFHGQAQQLAAAFLNANQSFVLGHGERKMLAVPMLRYATKQDDFWYTFRRSDDVVWQLNDPMPAIMQVFSLFELWRISRKEKITILEASTHDIEWNGE
jgi:predicted ATP-grasp superfamily ATP-dependent carboligase